MQPVAIASGPCIPHTTNAAEHRRSFNHARARARSSFRLMSATCFLTASAVYGQIAWQPHFEVASVKPAGDVFSARPATFDPAATDDEVRLMVQSLLTDRFKMRVHRVTKEATDGHCPSEKADSKSGKPRQSTSLLHRL